MTAFIKLIEYDWFHENSLIELKRFSFKDMIRINDDDLGITREITRRITECFQRGLIHSASAKMFMQFSKSAAEYAASCNLPIGLHINFSIPFAGKNISSKLVEKHNAVMKYLSLGKFSQVIYNLFLKNAI